MSTKTCPRYYTIFIWGCVEPQLYGPYDIAESRDAEAKQLAEDKGLDEHVYARLMVDETGKLYISPFVGGELGEDH